MFSLFSLIFVTVSYYCCNICVCHFVFFCKEISIKLSITGYGNIAPKTFWGRLVCIAYAVLGIPLMLLMLANIGEITANVFRYAYVNVCCCCLLYTSDAADE